MEAIVPPHLVVWCASSVPHIAPASRAKLARSIAAAVTGHPPLCAAYAFETLRLHAHLVAADDSGSEETPCSTSVAAARLGVVSQDDETSVRWMRNRVCRGETDSNMYRRYAYSLTAEAYEACEHTRVAVTAGRNRDDLARTQRLVQSYAKECTFKVHGDACIHHEVATCVVSPWMSACMAVNESPYNHACYAHGAHVNAVLRPLIETPTRVRVGDAAWRTNASAQSMIQVLHTIAELAGSSAWKVLTNASIMHHRDARAYAFVYRERSGKTTCGARKAAHFMHVSLDQPLSACVFDVLDACAVLGNEEAGQMLDAIKRVGANNLFSAHTATLSEVRDNPR